MPYGMYISAAGAEAQSQRLEIISHNLANADTPGFKRELAILQAQHAEDIASGEATAGSGGIDDVGGGVVLAETVTDFSLGKVRATGKPMHLPTAMRATKGAVEITFTDPLSPKVAENPESYNVNAWDLKRTANYGSKHYNERSWKVRTAKLSRDGKTVTLEIPEVAPTWGMEIRCFLETPEGKKVERRIHNTIHQLADK